jgi:hypothetical protein
MSAAIEEQTIRLILCGSKEMTFRTELTALKINL